MEDSIDIVQATTGSASIPSYRPDAKTRRYDRQLRLWASAGQHSLEQARVLLVGCDATGCQALKNLVLPGISQFTILSPLLTTAQDVATNFFLHPTSIGLPIAEETVKHLKELNPSVEGSARIDDPKALLASYPGFFTSFTLIIMSNLAPALELQMADLRWKASVGIGGPDIPLIAIRNSGFIGRVEIQLREHCVIDTHPETTHTLRIDQPFPALESYARSLAMGAMDTMEHSHVPWVVLLVRAGSLWKESHKGHLPDESNEKAEFKALLGAERRKGDEENYDEAVAQAYRFWSRSEIPGDLRKLLDDENVKTVSQNSKHLYLLLHALRLFVEAHHLPPISPTLPDMHSSTTSYIALQNLYKAQHLEDLATFRSLFRGVLETVGLSGDAIPEEEVEGFVKGSGGVSIIRGSPLRERKEIKGPLRDLIETSFVPEAEPEQLRIASHLALLAAERFYTAQGRWPGTEKDVTADIAVMEDLIRADVTSVVSDKELPEEVAKCIAETARGGFSTLPTTAAFLGGIVAQEAIKLATNQYTPLDNTMVVNLVQSTTMAFKA